MLTFPFCWFISIIYVTSLLWLSYSLKERSRETNVKPFLTDITQNKIVITLYFIHKCEWMCLVCLILILLMANVNAFKIFHFFNFILFPHFFFFTSLIFSSKHISCDSSQRLVSCEIFSPTQFVYFRWKYFLHHNNFIFHPQIFQFHLIMKHFIARLETWLCMWVETWRITSQTFLSYR
jgi:hypothetical protein